MKPDPTPNASPDAVVEFAAHHVFINSPCHEQKMGVPDWRDKKKKGAEPRMVS
jgi:hypothetical protein